jgi:hypothetical protein
MGWRASAAVASIVACCGLLAPASSPAAVAGHFATVLDTPATLANPTQTAQRNSYVVLQAWETERARELEAANPNLVVLAYQNLSAMAQGSGPDGLDSSGVSYSEAATAHPEWFLEEANGTRIAEEGYSWLWMADVGNPSYQQQWTANVLRLLRTGPWDGVMMDDTNATAKFHVYPASRIAKYPTDAAYQAAMGSMLAYAGPRIQAAGKLAIPNMGGWSEYPAVIKEWLPFVSGGVDEMFVKWSTVPGEGYRDLAGWRTQIEEVRTTEQLGKRFLAVTQAEPGDSQAVRYGWASLLLAANGRSSFLAGDGYDSETWSSEYEVSVGEPTGAASEVPGGAWKRPFAGGIVVVNPTTEALSVSLGGVYSGDGLSEANRATLQPHTALILTASGQEKKIGAESGSSSEGEQQGAGTSGSPPSEGSSSNSGTPHGSGSSPSGGSTEAAGSSQGGDSPHGGEGSTEAALSAPIADSPFPSQGSVPAGAGRQTGGRCTHTLARRRRGQARSRRGALRALAPCASAAGAGAPRRRARAQRVALRASRS